MKIRTGFVSNSSSSSFVVNTTDLTEEQINIIKCYGREEHDDDWDINFGEETIEGYTIMDNSTFEEYLEENNINIKLFKFKVW